MKLQLSRGLAVTLLLLSGQANAAPIADFEQARAALRPLLNIGSAHKWAGVTKEGKSCAVWGETAFAQFAVHVEVSAPNGYRDVMLGACNTGLAGCTTPKLYLSQNMIRVADFSSDGRYTHVLEYVSHLPAGGSSVRVRVKRRYGGGDPDPGDADVTCFVK